MGALESMLEVTLLRVVTIHGTLSDDYFKRR